MVLLSGETRLLWLYNPNTVPPTRSASTDLQRYIGPLGLERDPTRVSMCKPLREGNSPSVSVRTVGSYRPVPLNVSRNHNADSNDN